MSFKIVWERQALDDLARAWEISPSRERVEITDALNDLDKLLIARADTIGESRQHDTVRFVCVVPVVLTVHVSRRLGVVRVLSARVYRREE